jgi:hypothetical protein
VTKVQTDGISPKVKAVFYGLGGPGIILLILGIALDDDTLRTAGITALVAALGGGGLGYTAQPGNTKTNGDTP